RPVDQPERSGAATRALGRLRAGPLRCRPPAHPADRSRTADPRRVGRAVQTRTGGATDGREVGRAMKRGTPEHGKTLHLADVLGCERAEAVGLLELLWHFTARSAPQGDVGKFSNRQIVTGLYSSRDPDAVIAALQHTGWLDPHPRHRLIVHDWAHHLDQAVHKMLQRRGLKP